MKYHKTWTTNIPSLNEALGGGIPYPSIIEIFGPESSGKTSLSLYLTAQMQAAGKICAFIDAEFSLDIPYAKSLGVNIDELWISQPQSAEQAFEIVHLLTKSGAVDFIVVDSIAALIPEREKLNPSGFFTPNVHATAIKKAMRQQIRLQKFSDTCIVLTNHQKNEFITPGGRAMQLYPEIRLATKPITQNTERLSMAVHVIKNKYAESYKMAQLDIYYHGKIVSV